MALYVTLIKNDVGTEKIIGPQLFFLAGIGISPTVDSVNFLKLSR